MDPFNMIYSGYIWSADGLIVTHLRICVSADLEMETHNGQNIKGAIDNNFLSVFYRKNVIVVK